MKLIFLDESGSAKNWRESINDQPFHVLGGVMIDSQAYFSAIKSLRDAVKNLGLENNNLPLGHGFEIKAGEIARGSGWWKNNKEKRNAIREIMLSFPSQYGGTSFIVVIDKKKLMDQYAQPDEPYKLAFQYMFERLQWKLEELQDNAICVYDQTKYLDDDLHDASVDLIRDGSPVRRWDQDFGYVVDKLKIDRINEFYLGKSNNSIGLQVSDYIATFGYQYFRQGKPVDCGWWETLVRGLYRKEDRLEGCGLKVFPINVQQIDPWP